MQEGANKYFMIDIDQPNKFNALYECMIQASDEKVFVRAPTINYHDIDAESFSTPLHAEHIVTIKLPMSEYNKFLRNWNEYMTILEASSENPYIGEQLHQLLVLATLYK